jgi:hypothetical protein
LLFSRLLLFGFFQTLIAFALHSWTASTKYWLLTATLGNIASIVLLIILCRREGIKYLSIFRFSKRERKKDLLLFLALALLSMPLVLFPGPALSKMLWGHTDYDQQLLFQPIPVYLIYFLLFAFPVTIAFAELATYFGYILPRLKIRMKSKWLVVLLPVFFLSIQHCTLPLVFEAKFILLRALMFLPFAIMLGIAINKRPTLLPYFAVLHGLLDAMTVMMLLVEPNNR